eukprot:Skav215872  [mRNA]  locus=scaffold2770:94274:108251:- [translate_table: standard]
MECLKEQSKLCICIMGPPGVNRSKYCQQIAADYKLKHVHVGKLARKELKDQISAGELVADDVVIELVKDLLRELRDQEQESVYKTICSNLHYRGQHAQRNGSLNKFSNAPLRMHRICVLGPCASGRTLTTQCNMLSKRLGVVHVDGTSAPTDTGHLHFFEQLEAPGEGKEEVPPEFVGDEEACALIGSRLRQTDCVRKGWVLDGFPKTRAQAELQVADAVVETRVSSRRVDPMTGIAYYTNPNSVAIRQRLVQCPHDQPDKVRERVALFGENIQQIADSWKRVTARDEQYDRASGWKQICQNIFSRQTLARVRISQDPNAVLRDALCPFAF